jgi:hypothetical protein
MVKRKKYRLGGIVATIGYIILIPSFLGMLLGFLALFATGSAGNETKESLKTEVAGELRNAAVPENLVAKVTTMEEIQEADLAGLTDEQRQAVSDGELSMSAGSMGADAGTAIAGGFSLFLIVSSFVGGLLGWLLILKKRVLQCNNCGAVVAAS